MKLKGTLSSQGVRRLEKEFLPCLEKHGKSCTLLLNPDDVHVIQQASDTDGMQITVRWAREVLFDLDSYKCSSKHNNLIAFSFEVALLLRVLRSAGATDSDALEVKLAMRQLPAVGEAASVSKPYLAFSSSGHDLNMTHDLPVSKPFGPAEIDRLNQEKDVTQVCPFYLDLLSEAARLQGVVDKLKSLCPIATFVTSKQGHIYLEVSGSGVHMATELQGLAVLPEAMAATANALTSVTPEERLHEALDMGDATSVVIHLKHFARTLHSVAMMAPAQVLVGIAEDLGHVHFMFVYQDQDQAAGYDDSINFSCKLPVRVEE